MATLTSIEVARKDLHSARIVSAPLDIAAATAAGKAVLAIDRFALTANNITYGAFGDQMSYWDFFPASGGYGHIPVWGFADVAAAPATSGLTAGERVYGYFPMASHLVIEPGKVSPKRVVDMTAHRAKLPPVYNVYERTTADAGYTRTGEAAQMILRPLTVTSFLIADFLDDNTLFGASQVLVSSASSKTSLGLALCLKKLGRSDLIVTGLTSSGNRAFVEGTRLYDRVVDYGAVASLDASVPSVYVDMAGSVKVLTTVHEHFRDHLKYSCRVGATHVDDIAGRIDVPGARPVFFFAPTQVQKRVADWGPGGLEQRFGALWPDLTGAFGRWMQIDERRGAEAVLAAYHETLEGRQKAETGLVLGVNA